MNEADKVQIVPLALQANWLELFGPEYMEQLSLLMALPTDYRLTVMSRLTSARRDFGILVRRCGAPLNETLFKNLVTVTCLTALDNDRSCHPERHPKVRHYFSWGRGGRA